MREVSDICALAGENFGMAERGAGALTARVLPDLTISMPGLIAFSRRDRISNVWIRKSGPALLLLQSRRGTSIPTVFLTPEAPAIRNAPREFLGRMCPRKNAISSRLFPPRILAMAVRSGPGIAATLCRFYDLTRFMATPFRCRQTEQGAVAPPARLG